MTNIDKMRSKMEQKIIRPLVDQMLEDEALPKEAVDYKISWSDNIVCFSTAASNRKQKEMAVLIDKFQEHANKLNW